jgi:uncharacterized protein (TIGR02246 family)
MPECGEENLMRPIAAVLVCAVLVCAVLTGAVSVIHAQGNAEDERTVRKVLRDVHDALSARDLKAFGQFFAEDAEFVNVSASYAKGREEIVKMHDRAVNVVFKGIDFKALEAKAPEPVVTLRFLRPDVAIAHIQLDPGDCPPCAAAAAAMHNQPPAKGSRQVMTWVLSKHEDRWLIDSGQNTVWGLVPAPPASAPK